MQLRRLAGCIDRGLTAVADEQKVISEHVKEVARVQATLDQESGTSAQRQARFESLQGELASCSDGVRQQMAVVMVSFLAGLFVGGEDKELPQDNLELERWFRLPKGHERRIHGHRHAGVRLVQQGATLIPALDAHRSHDGPFTAEDFQPYRNAQAPPCQQEALHRRTVMRKARSKKKRILLLAGLEHRYKAAP
jgi:hypothetical protein